MLEINMETLRELVSGELVTEGDVILAASEEVVNNRALQVVLGLELKEEDE